MITLIVLALTSADCAGCHAAQASAFAESRHASASQLAVFRASLAHAQTRWCASCHRPTDAAGLECTSCHAVAGDPSAIRAARPATAAARAAHAVVVDERLGSHSCAACHEFKTPLPDHLDPVVYSTQPLQSTVTEAGDRACNGCHDPHRPIGAHDPELLKKTLAITARSTPTGVELRVTAQHVGHRFPTGDPFRRLVLEVCDDRGCSAQTIGRSFALVDGVWAPVIDRSLADGETRVLAFPAGTSWRATFRYGDPRFERGLPASEAFVVVAAGQL